MAAGGGGRGEGRGADPIVEALGMGLGGGGCAAFDGIVSCALFGRVLQADGRIEEDACGQAAQDERQERRR